MSYYHRGNLKHPTCVFLHGFLGAKEDWEPLCAILSERYSCLCVDLPGHGASNALTPDYLAQLRRQIDTLVNPPVRLIGYSMGGRIAMQLAEAFTGWVSHLICISAHPGISDGKELCLRASSDALWIKKLQHMSIEEFLTEWYDQPLFHSLKKRPHLLQDILKRRSSQDPQRMAEVLDMLSIARQHPVTSFPKRTLFIYGEEDTKYQQIYRACADRYSVCMVADAGHIVHLENPVTCAQHILQWMEEDVL